MENVLASANIKLLTYHKDNGDEVHYAYSPKMLYHDIFVEFYEEGDHLDEFFETLIKVFFKDDSNVAYEFTMFYADDIIPQQDLNRHVAEFIQIIDASDVEKLADILKNTAKSYTISSETELPMVAQFLHEDVTERIERVYELINE